MEYKTEQTIGASVMLVVLTLFTYMIIMLIFFTIADEYNIKMITLVKTGLIGAVVSIIIGEIIICKYFKEDVKDFRDFIVANMINIIIAPLIVGALSILAVMTYEIWMNIKEFVTVIGVMAVITLGISGIIGIKYLIHKRFIVKTTKKIKTRRKYENESKHRHEKNTHRNRKIKKTKRGGMNGRRKTR